MKKGQEEHLYIGSVVAVEIRADIFPQPEKDSNWENGHILMNSGLICEILI